MRSVEPDGINKRIILLASQEGSGLRYYNLRLSLSIKADILSHRLKRMEKAGLIGKMGSGRDATYYATQKGLEFLKESEKPKRQYVNGRVSESPAQERKVEYDFSTKEWAEKGGEDWLPNTYIPTRD